VLDVGRGEVVMLVLEEEEELVVEDGDVELDFFEEEGVRLF